MPRVLKFDERLERYPPILCRLLATQGRGREKTLLSDEQIVNASGLTISDVMALSWAFTWDAVNHQARRKFLAACGLDLEDNDQFERLEYMRRRGRFRYLKDNAEMRRRVDAWCDATESE